MINRIKAKTLLLLFLFLMIFVPSAYALDVTPIYQYQFEADPDMPEMLPVGKNIACGNYSLRLLQQPVIGKYTNKLISDNDLEYLMVRVEITNTSSEALGWLTPESFKVIDTYKGRMYSAYNLDVTASAATVQGYGQKLFIEKIGPGDTMLTTLVFSVYPDVDGWVMRFSPQHYYEDPTQNMISFLLPEAVRYSEGVPR